MENDLLKSEDESKMDQWFAMCFGDLLINWTPREPVGLMLFAYGEKSSILSEGRWKSGKPNLSSAEKAG